MPEKLAEARDHPIPEAVQYLWEWYCAMAEQRKRNEKGAPLPLSVAEMLEWCRVFGSIPTRWELQALRGLERTFLSGVNRWMTSPS